MIQQERPYDVREWCQLVRACKHALLLPELLHINPLHPLRLPTGVPAEEQADHMEVRRLLQRE